MLHQWCNDRVYGKGGQLAHPYPRPLTDTLGSSMALTKASESMEAERMVSVRPR